MNRKTGEGGAETSLGVFAALHMSANGRYCCKTLFALVSKNSAARRVGIVMPYAKGDTESDARVRAFRQELGRMPICQTTRANVKTFSVICARRPERLSARPTNLIRI
jgi:hypothetical protein